MEMRKEQDSVYCRECGGALGSGVEFCLRCGNKRGAPVIYQKRTGLSWSSRESDFVLLGGVLIIVGLMPFFLMDTTFTGVTNTIRLLTSAGIIGVAGGLGMILYQVLPRVWISLR